MLKNISKFEVNIAGKLYHFLCDNDSPIAHVKEAFFQMMQAVGKIEEIQAQQQTASPAAEEPVSPVAPEATTQEAA